MYRSYWLFIFCAFFPIAQAEQTSLKTNQEHNLILSSAQYENAMHGFWLGQSIANWTGLVTEMDKIGNIGDIKTGDFYTSKDWGKSDKPSIWGQGVPSDLSDNIDFVLAGKNDIWGADDDTDIEYIYQSLMAKYKVSILTSQQIRDGWIEHIYASNEPTPFGKDPDNNYENFLWVSNQKAHDLMLTGMLPPETGKAHNNEHYNMIDAQLTTEIFGLYAPANPSVALKMAYLPIRTVASKEAANIAEFYVVMYALSASFIDKEINAENVIEMAQQARQYLASGQYPAKMFDFVMAQYTQGKTWEQARDAVYQRYQVDQKDGYTITSQNLYCNGCFAAGINYAASLISLFYGEGDFKETVKIATLAGWDSDNPAATWGGMLGFVLGKSALEAIFELEFSEKFNIHRTRRNFPNNGIDTFPNMAKEGVEITKRALQEFTSAKIGLANWDIPKH